MQGLNVKNFTYVEPAEAEELDFAFNPLDYFSEERISEVWEGFLNKPDLTTAAYLSILFPEEFEKIRHNKQIFEKVFSNYHKRTEIDSDRLESLAYMRIAFPQSFKLLGVMSFVFEEEIQEKTHGYQHSHEFAIRATYLFSNYKLAFLNQPDVDKESLFNSLELERRNSHILYALRILFPEDKRLRSILTSEKFWDFEKVRLLGVLPLSIEVAAFQKICGAKTIEISESGLILNPHHHAVSDNKEPLPIERNF